MINVALKMGGSTHECTKGGKWCLIAASDDATSDVSNAKFFKVENLRGFMQVVRKIIEIKGVPWAFYLDRPGCFAGFRPNDQTQLKRICKDLGITIIPSYSPQRKGRIERVWNTLQNRLVAELEHYKIDTMEDANEYINDKFIPETGR
jgi:hypothetical protein